MKKYLVGMLAALLVLTCAAGCLAGGKTMADMDAFIEQFNLYAPDQGWETIETIQFDAYSADLDLGQVVLGNGVSIIFSLDSGTRDIHEILVLAPTVLTAEGVWDAFVQSGIAVIQSAGAMEGEEDILALFEETGFDPENEAVSEGVRETREIEGIQYDVLLNEKSGAILMLSYPE